MIKEMSTQVIEVKKADVCAWCHGEYDEKGQVVRYLSDEEFSLVKSHGICKGCKVQQLMDAKQEYTEKADLEVDEEKATDLRRKALNLHRKALKEIVVGEL